jgi:RimJ/RimL family protein N-acetyltransferase
METAISKLLIWENDESIRHLHLVTRSEEEFKGLKVTYDELLENVRKVHESEKAFFWCIFYQNEPVGLLTAQIDPRQLLRQIPGTFWPSILIGEAAVRGKGVGRQAMIWCEELAREMSCGRIELGVFEFNEVARKLYASLGYVEFARIPDFTWWNGKLRADIRLEKLLSEP